jgi:hypothetical protein
LKRIMISISTAVVAGLVAASPASAVSPSEQACTDRGGEFQRVNGEVQCVVVEEGKNPKFTSTETTTGQGNAGNKPTEDSDCAGTGSGKCPGGQF